METLFEIITPWFDPTATAAERNAVIKDAARHLFVKLFIVDPHIQVNCHPGSKDMPNEFTIMSTIHRGTPVSQWPNTVWKMQKCLAEELLYPQIRGPTKEQNSDLPHSPSQGHHGLHQPPTPANRTSFGATAQVLGLDTFSGPTSNGGPSPVAFLHGTVNRANAKELQEAIMSHLCGRGCDIKIVLKSEPLKKSPREELTMETRAFGMMVFCAAKDYRQCLQKLSQIYLANVKSGFPLDRKYTVIPDMCSPCFTDHSSDECIPVLETYRASQVETHKLVHEITLTGCPVFTLI